MIEWCLRVVCPWAQEYFHPREIALLLASALGFLSLMVASMSLADASADNLYHWRHREWKEMQCSVEQTGITYLGDCDTALNETETLKKEHLAPEYPYSDCIEQDLPESCIHTMSEAFLNGRRLSPAADAGTGAGAGADAGADVGASPRRLKPRKHNAEICEDDFVPWAQVRIREENAEGSLSFCAFNAGLIRESMIRDFKIARGVHDQWHRGNYVPCWVVKLQSEDWRQVDRCRVVAIQDPTLWPHSSKAWLDQQAFMKKIMMVVAVCFAMCSAATMSFYNKCHVHGIQRWSDVVNMVIIEADEDEEDLVGSARTRFVRNRWQLFQANVMAGYTRVSARDVDVSEKSETPSAAK